MSSTKPPRRGTPKAVNPGAPASSAQDNPWASYDDADDWSITSDRPMSRADPTGRLDTRDHQAVAKALGAAVSLHVVQSGEGSNTGEVYAIVKSPTTLGRGRDNDIVLADASISRNHAVLEQRASGWHIVDKASGNGLFVRGKRVAEALLTKGDLVALGQVHLRLEIASGAGAPAPQQHSRAGARSRDLVDVPQEVSGIVAPPSRKPAPAQPPAAPTWRRLLPWTHRTGAAGARPSLPRRLVLPAAAAATLVLLTLFGRTYLHHSATSAQSFALCSRGIEAFGAQRWDEAEQAFADALALRPHSALARTYQEALLVARRDAARLADAQERRERGDFQSAREALAGLHSTSFVRAAWLEAGRYGAAISQVAMQTETALGAGLTAEAHALLQSLGQPPPPRPDLAALTAWGVQREAQAGLETAARAQGLRARAIPSLWEQAQTQSPAMRQAIGLFRRSGAQAGPILGLRRIRLPQTPAEHALVQALKRFAGLFETGLVEHRGKRAFAAIKLFGEARAEAIKIAGDNSLPAREVEGKMADMYYVLGVQGLMAGHLAEASEALHTAVRLRPGHSLSLRRLDELNDRAERMVDEAEFMGVGHASKAQELLRQVLSAMPADAAVSVRARKLLSSLVANR